MPWLTPPAADLPYSDRGDIGRAVLVRGAAIEEDRLAAPAVQLGRWIRRMVIVSAVFSVFLGLFASVVVGWWPFAVIGILLAGLSGSTALRRANRAIRLNSALLNG